MLADLLIYFHLVFVAVGLGIAVRLDILFFLGRNVRPGQVLLADTAFSHRMISTAVLGLWGSGLGLVYVRTGFVLDEFSPKLWMKLLIVTSLSVNAIFIGTYVMPMMERFKDRPVLAIPLKFRLPMAISAATSVFCWFTALALGSMTMLQAQPWDILVSVIAIEYAFGLFVAISIAVWVRVPQQAAPAHDTSGVQMHKV